MTNGSERWRRFAPYVLAVALLTVAVAGNIASTMDRAARAGQPVSPWVLLVDELTSAVAWLAALPVILRAFRSFLPPRRSLATAIPVHLALIPAVSLGHYVLTRILRALIFAVQGETFVFRFSWSDFAGDFYKDVLNYFLLGLIGSGAEQLFLRRAGQPAPAGLPAATAPVIEVRDGAQTVYLTVGEILWVEAAGNYVEIHAATGRTLLMRATLGNLAERLRGAGFLRIHRSRLVNAAVIAGIDNMPAGEARLTLSDGTMLVASRSYRAAIAAAMDARVRGTPPPAG